MPPKPKRKQLSFEAHKKFLQKTHKPIEVVSPFQDRGISRYTNYEVGGNAILSKPKKMAQTLGSQKKTKSGYVGSTRYK